MEEIKGSVFDLNTKRKKRSTFCCSKRRSSKQHVFIKGHKQTPFFLCVWWKTGEAFVFVLLTLLVSSCPNLCYLNALSPSGHRLLIRDSGCLYRCGGDPLDTSSGTEGILFRCVLTDAGEKNENVVFQGFQGALCNFYLISN